MSDKEKKKITEQEQPIETTEEAAVEAEAAEAAAPEEETAAEAAAVETIEEAAAEETAKVSGLTAWIKSHKAAAIATACAAAVLIVAVGTVAAVSLSGKNTAIPLASSTQTTTTEQRTASQSSTAPTSEAVLVTDQSGKPVTDASGKTVTSLVGGGTTKIEVVTKANGATETRIITAPTTVKTTAKAPANTPTNAPTKAPTKAPTAAPTAAPHSHSYTAVQTVAATCTSRGYTVYRCSCGDQYTGNETAALGHSYSCTDHQDAAPGREGYNRYTCSRCGDSYTETIAALPVQTATAAEVEAFANAYMESKGLIIDYSYDPYLDNCGYNPPFGWTRGETMEDLKEYIIASIEFDLDNLDLNRAGAYVRAYAEEDNGNGGWLYICY